MQKYVSFDVDGTLVRYAFHEPVPSLFTYAFWVGGLICALCQVLIDKTKLTPARVLVSLVVLGVILQGDVYKRQCVLPLSW